METIVKTMTLAKIVLAAITTTLAFIGSYFLHLSAENFEQYIAVVAVVFCDGFFGILAGSKKKGFQTKKALRVPITAFIWLCILTITLVIEKGFTGTFWLSETICAPFIIFQLVSTLKNIHTLGFIQEGLLSEILFKIDRHKFDHDEDNTKSENTENGKE